MDNATTGKTATSRTDSYDRLRDRRKKRIQNAKNIGSVAMYIGMAGLIMPAIQNAREKQNPILSTCTLGAGAMLSIALGKIASDTFKKAVDKTVDFYEDINPPTPSVKEGKKNG